MSVNIVNRFAQSFTDRVVGAGNGRGRETVVCTRLADGIVRHGRAGLVATGVLAPDPTGMDLA
jgi:hypothetical protein